uniref:Uncharacterized protein n=1 Tax=Enterobacter cloacae TaxID=550 RepID=A0A5P1PJT7_ENTCL|nr:hypothetical protein [Enterobacter cloacae]
MPFHRQDSFRDHCGVSPGASDMSTHLQNSLSPPGGEAVLSDQG